MKKICIINGPNLNLLGEREPEIYGTETLEDINKSLNTEAKKTDSELRFYQSNHEGGIIDIIHNNRKWMDGLIINPGAYTHTSIAIRDAITILSCPIFEVHLSDISKREDFRRHSYITPVVTDIISGFGSKGYLMALNAILEK